MKKIFLYCVFVLIFLFTGCAQQFNSSNSINGLKLPQKSQAQTAQNNQSTAPMKSSDSQGNLSPSPSKAQTGDKNKSAQTASSAAKQDGSETGAASNSQQSNSSASATKTQPGAKVFEIKEKMFIQQCDDIYTNPSDYKDKLIKLEGMYDEFTDTETGKTHCVIYRKTPGCCGNDGSAGFEFVYNGKKPKPNDWIKATGTIEVAKDSSGYENIILHLTELVVSDKRGAEFVNY